MVFSSSTFLWLFLPVFWVVYGLSPDRFRTRVILAGSLGFYGWWRLDFLCLLLLVTAWTWLWGQVLVQREGTARRRALTTGIVGNLGALAFFKYWNFGVDNLNMVLSALGSAPVAWTAVILPIGISFYVFQAISYLVDVHRGDAPPEKSFLTFAAFISLFPQLIAGPVLRYKDLADQFHAREHHPAFIKEGLRRFAIGLCMKVLVADIAAPLADRVFAAEHPTLVESWLGAAAYTIQLFFDFAGYSHMAIGLGLVMGFRFVENFDQPYISGSITEFWRRWHISLSTWLRDYLYIPLGGNRGGETRTYINLLLTMLLGGLWHGAAWTFVLWGAWHGGWLALERRYRHRLPATGLDSPIAWGRTLVLVMIGWVFFRATSVLGAFDMLAGMVGLHGVAVRDTLAWQLPPSGVAATILGSCMVLAQPLYQRWAKADSLPSASRWTTTAATLGLSGAFVGAVLRLGAAQHSPFLYFQF